MPFSPLNRLNSLSALAFVGSSICAVLAFCLGVTDRPITMSLPLVCSYLLQAVIVRAAHRFGRSSCTESSTRSDFSSQPSSSSSSSRS